MPLPGYVLLYTPELIPAINFDVFHFLEKYWRDLTIFDYINNEHLLGINFVTFGFDSVHFVDNTRSSLAITLLLLVMLIFVSVKVRVKKVREYMVASFLVLLKTVVYMVFVISAII